MASPTDERHRPPGTPFNTTGCQGQCQYTYDAQAGCYFLTSSNCSPNCGCPPFVNGPLAQVVRAIRSAATSSGLTLSCTAQAPQAVPDEANEKLMVQAIAELIRRDRQADRETAKRWKFAAVGLGVLAVLLAVALIAALMTR